MAVLWRMAVCCSDSLVHEAATSLLVEVHHRIPQIKFKNCDAIRGHILRISFRQLSIAMQSLRAGDSEKGRTDRPADRIETSNERWEGFSPSGSSSTEMFGITGPLGETDGSLPVTVRESSISMSSVGSGPWDEWFDDGDILLDPKAIARVVARLIMLLLLYIQRFDQQPAQLITLQVLAGRDDSPVLTLTLRSTETVGTLRARVANHFKESPEVISLLKPGRSTQLLSGTFLGGGQERLEKNDVTLRQAKFLPHDSVIARKKDVPTPSGPSRSPAEKSGPLTEDLITFKDLSGDLLAVIQPLQWLVSSVADVETPLSPTGSLSGAPSLLQSTFQLPAFPLPVKSDMTLLPYGDSAQDRNLMGMPSLSAPQPTATTTVQIQQTGVLDANVPLNGRLSDSLIPLLRQSPQHMDQLLAMLDGYLSTEIQGAAGVDFDLSAAVWEVLQSLPTHPALLKQVRDMPYERTGGSIRVLLNLASPYRLLYVLQMIDSFLAEGDKGSGSQIVQVSDWALQFLHMGGAEHLVHLIDCTIKLIKQENSDKSESSENQKERNSSQKSDGDATTLILGLLYRSLHRLLLLDPLYSRWQVSSQYSSHDSRDDKGNSLNPLYEYPPISSHTRGGSKETTEKSSKAPPGLVLTCISTASFVKAAMECVYRSESTGPGSAPLQALAENAFVVVMGLLTANEKGVEVLHEATSGASALTFPSVSSVNHLNSKTDIIDDSDSSFLKSRSVSKQSMHEVEMSASEIPSLQQWIKCLCLTHKDKQVRRKICHCVFNVLANIFYLTADSAIKKEEKAQKMLLFDCIFHSVVCTAHAGYELCRVSDVHANQIILPNRPHQATSQPSSRTASPASPVTSPHLQSEQIYSLLASLLSLRGIPRLIFPSNLDAEKSFNSPLQHIASEVHNRDAGILIDLFASQVSTLLIHRGALCCSEFNYMSFIWWCGLSI